MNPLPFKRRQEPLPAISSRRYFASHFPQRRDGAGNKLCRWCYGALPKGRRAWCSDECVHEYNALSDLRQLIYYRDGKCCRLCGVDIGQLDAIEQAYSYFCRDWDLLLRKVGIHAPYYWWTRFWRQVGWADYRGHLYEMDHILAMELGGLTHPDNLRTLCIPCHKAETKKLAGILAKARRREKKLKAHQQAMIDDD